MTNIITTIQKWFSGIRVYIALATLLLTAEVYWWTSAVYGESSLAAIRLQEIYAWIAVGLLLLTLSIGPACALFKKLPGKAILRDARRLLGVSAAWFASLHVGISYFDQFKGVNPFNLPVTYQQAFAVGLIALLILLALAFTSFDAAFRKLGIWWFRLHRLIYLAVLLTLVHAFSIGVHATSMPFMIVLAVVIGLLFIMSFYLRFLGSNKPTTWQSVGLIYGLIITVGIFIYGFSQRTVAPITDEKSSQVNYE